MLLIETRLTDKGARQQLIAAIERAAIEVTGLKPDEMVLLEPHSIPKTTSGKLQRSLARMRYREGTLIANSPQRGLVMVLSALARSWRVRMRRVRSR